MREYLAHSIQPCDLSALDSHALIVKKRLENSGGAVEQSKSAIKLSAVEFEYLTTGNFE